MDDLETEVLVIGAGPVGMTLGLLLADLGVSAMLVDKRETISDQPRARGLNARGAEILRMVGVEEDMVAHALPVKAQLEVRSDLAHPPVLVQPTGGDTLSTVSPCEGIAISQDVLETVLRRHVERRPSLTLRLGWRLTGLGDSAHARGRAASAMDPEGRTRQIRARFVVGADGWRSDVRSLLGIDLTGQDDLGRMRAVRFTADLRSWLGDPPPAFVRLTGVDGVLLATHSDHRWVQMAPTRDADEPSPETFVADGLGTDAAVTVLADGHWTAAVQQAVRFGDGDAFLVGDAAHRVTPAGATGITSGMADAANLAWKLAGALRGWAGPNLLESYRQEREPVATWIGAANVRLWTDSQQGRPSPIDLRWLEFGYRYASDVIDPVPGSLDQIDLASTFVPRAAPGDRAPHARLPDGRSTIDLTGPGFALLTADTGSEWQRAAHDAGARHHIPLTAVTGAGADVRTTFDLADGEAVLIRPDGHIAWRSDTGPTPETASRRLDDAVRRAAGW